jgi:hypothetical protein
MLFQVTKPLLERKRRARINKCLDELKDLMVGALEVGTPNDVQHYLTSSSGLRVMCGLNRGHPAR